MMLGTQTTSGSNVDDAPPSEKRVPPNGEVVLESTDMGVALYEAREVTGPLGGVPKTA